MFWRVSLNLSRQAFINLLATLQQAYDQHLNMILGDVEETITSVEIDDETYEEIIKVILALILHLVCAAGAKLHGKDRTVTAHGRLMTLASANAKICQVI